MNFQGLKLKFKIVGVCAFILGIFLVSLASSSDYCFLKMKNGESITTDTGRDFTCTHTSCQVCTDNGESYAAWNKCSNASLCPQSENTNDNLNPNGNTKSAVTAKNSTKSNTGTTNYNETTITNSQTNDDVSNISDKGTGFVVTTGKRGASDNNKNTSPIVMLGLISAGVLFIGVIVLLIAAKKKQKKRKKKKIK
jgi:hypothetical protein